MSYAKRLPTVLAVLAMAGALSGCVPQGLAFRVDDRLSFDAPKDRTTVKLPVTIDWTIRDFDVTEPGTRPHENAGYFAVFVDTSPMPPGKSLSWLARDDDSCRATDGCPDVEYLEARGVYTTTDTKLTLEQLPLADDENRSERHRAVIVLLDASSKRIGESAFEIAFDVSRTEQS